jgi:superfamily II DNA helicase RecQ
LEKKCLQTLQALLGNGSAKWASPQQKDAVVSVMQRERDVIAMLKTGGGKSMLPIIAAIMEPKEAVVVVLPLRSLMSDWERKLKGMGVPFQVYDPTKPLGTTINLILVSADKAKFKTWRQKLAELDSTLSVSRMVFDEAHLPLLSNDFRESMRDMLELRQFPMQLVLLSGTIPPSSVAALKTIFGLTNNAYEIRQSNNRPELEYILKPPAPSSDIEEETIQIVAKERKEWSAKDRGLVFVAYMEDGDSLAEKVNQIMVHRCMYMLMRPL